MEWEQSTLNELNKGFDSKFLKNYWVLRQKPEEGWWVQWSKCKHDNQDKDTNLNRKVYNNTNSSSQEFQF